MAELKRDVPSEAVISCPNYPKKAKIHTIKDHIKTVHGETVSYKCTITLPNGSQCGFSCGERIGCFNQHQTREHNMDFYRKSKHPYGESTGFFLKVGGKFRRSIRLLAKLSSNSIHLQG